VTAGDFGRPRGLRAQARPTGASTSLAG